VWKLINKALDVVPASRWAVGISGAIAAFSIVVAYFDGISRAFMAGIAILVLMILMVLFGCVAQLSRATMRPIAIVLAWSFTLLFVGSSIATASSLFWDEPKPFQQLCDEIASVLGSAEAAANIARTDDEEQRRKAAEATAAEERLKLQQKLDAAESQLRQLTAEALANTPPKKVTVPIGGGLYKTISYWSGGKRSRVTWCQPEPVPVDGMTTIGAAETKSFDSRKFLTNPSPNPRGCAPARHCDSHNEFCRTFYRNAGCYVSTEWLEWYRAGRKREGLPERQDDICPT
jgi:hypothetical protein